MQRITDTSHCLYFSGFVVKRNRQILYLQQFFLFFCSHTASNVFYPILFF